MRRGKPVLRTIRLMVASIVCVAAPAAAQQLPAQTNIRTDEDWSVIADTDSGKLPAWTAAKYQPLDPDGVAWISTGLEIRTRYEGYENIAWSDAKKADDGYLWVRVMPHADVHAGPVRIFVQGIGGYAIGLANAPTPADRTGIDLLQGFGEVSVADGALRLRAGRELVSLGTERLVGIRYGPNIPQPFDGEHATASLGSVQLQLMHLRPVDIGPGDLDDRTSRTKRLDAAYATVKLEHAGLDAYVLDFRNRAARFDQGAASEHRLTYGLRFFGSDAGWTWNWELMVQRGRFGGDPIRAWSLGTDTSYRISPLTLRLRADVISGDRNPNDRTLGSFNPMFPKGKYFGELTPLAPSNILDLHPSVDFTVTRDLTIGITDIEYWRHSTGDGIYGFAGNLLRSGRASDARRIGRQQEVVLNWHPHPLIYVLASYSLFEPGAFVRDTGPAETIHMAALELMFRL